MKSENFDISTPDGTCDAFAAYPDGSGPWPAVIFFMDAFGVRPYLHEMVQTLAGYGYYVLLPNVFYRVRRAPVLDLRFPVRPEDMPEVRRQFPALIENYTTALAARDTAAFVDFLSKCKQARAGRIGAVGYCMGAVLAVRAAAQFPDRIAAVAGFHGGRLVTDAPDSPHRLLARAKAEFYFAHADQDAHCTSEQIQTLEKALREPGLRFESELLKGAMHGFTMKDLPPYNESALKRHWEKLPALFKRALA